MINAIYNKDVLRLAADITCIGTLDNSDANASLRSPLCGSSINVSINVKHGRVTAYSQEIKACALGQASASVLAQAVIGKSKNDIQSKEIRYKIGDTIAKKSGNYKYKGGNPELESSWDKI